MQLAYLSFVSFLMPLRMPSVPARMHDGSCLMENMMSDLLRRNQEPLKRLTIPRLELQGAVLASRLCKTIVEESRFKFGKVVLFLDSKIVLAWIRSEARKFKPFVSVRIGEIRRNTNPAQWKYVPGELNVADDVSRGIAAQSLVERWQHGPKFLRLLSGRKIRQQYINLK